METQMPSDEQIQNWVHDRHGFVPEPAWIAHCKQLCGLTVANVRVYQHSRFNPCPAARQAAIIEAFRHFGLLPLER